MHWLYLLLAFCSIAGALYILVTSHQGIAPRPILRRKQWEIGILGVAAECSILFGLLGLSPAGFVASLGIWFLLLILAIVAFGGVLMLEGRDL